jgi:uncharacterized protein
MLINVAHLLKADVGARQAYTIDEAYEYQEGDTSTTWVKGKAAVLRTDKGLLVSAALELDAASVCARCLERYRCKLPVRFEEEFFPSVDINTGAPVAPPEEPGAFTIDANHQIDLTEAARQYLLAQMPIRLICREDCRGLCPQCGRNLNAGECCCEPAAQDSRWGALRDFRPVERPDSS